MIVTVLLGVTNAYVSVLSATGSFEMAGASRCDDISRFLSACAAQHAGHERLVGEPDLTLAEEDLDLSGGGVGDLDQHRTVVGELELGGRQWRLGVVARQRDAAGDETGGADGAGRSLDQEGTSGDGIHALPLG